MGNHVVARRYALAIFALAAERADVPQVGADLRAIARALLSEQRVKRLYLSPVVSRREKTRLLGEAFASRIHDIALHAVLLLVRKRREGLLREIVDEYAVLEREARGADPLTVTSASELAPAQLQELVARLERIYGKRFDVTQKVEPGLIGGIRLTMGDRRIDGTVSGRLERLTRSLFAREQ